MRKYLGHNLDQVEVYKPVTFTTSVQIRGVPDVVTWNLRNLGFRPEVVPLGSRIRGFKWDLGLTQVRLSPVKKMDWEVLAFIHAEPLHTRQADAACDARNAIQAVTNGLEEAGYSYSVNSPLLYSSVHFHVDTCGYPWGRDTLHRVVNRTRFKVGVPDGLSPEDGVKIGTFFERYNKSAQILAKPTAAYIVADWEANGYDEKEDGEVGRSEYRLDRERLRRWGLPFDDLWPRCLDEVRLVRRPKAKQGVPFPDPADWPDDPLWALYRSLWFRNPFGDASALPPGRPVHRDRRLDQETRGLLRTLGRLVALHDLDDENFSVDSAYMVVADLLTAPGASASVRDAAERMRRLLGPRQDAGVELTQALAALPGA